MLITSSITTQENYSMGNMVAAVRFVLVAGFMAASLSACGDSTSSSSSSYSTTAVAKTASWTNVSVRALDGKININWDKTAGTTFGTVQSTYNIYCSTNPTDIMLPANRIATRYAGTSYDHSDVINGQPYFYAITEVNATGESPASRIVSATPQAQFPAAPYGLKVTSLDRSVKVELAGATSPATVSYYLYRSSSRLFTPATTTRFSVPSFAAPYDDLSLANGTIWYYAVTATAGGKESHLSPVAAARPQAVTAAVSTSPTQLAAFASPTEMSAEAGSGTCTITWQDVAPLVSTVPDQATSPVPCYTLYWSDSPDVLNNVKGKAIDATKGLTKGADGKYTYKLTGLTNGTTYYFQLTAGVRGVGGFPIPERATAGPVVAVTPGLKTPAIPAGVSATQGEQQVLLTWSKDNSGITGVTYNIYVSTTAAATPAELMAKGVRKNNPDSSRTHYTHSGLQTGQTYYYVVTAVGEGESAPSSIVSVTL
jgi:fibronectin type 3 domain-containing protein